MKEKRSDLGQNKPERPLTLVIGVSAQRTRYANLAVNSLVQHGYPVVALGLRPGRVNEIPIQTGLPALHAVHTISLYLNAERQQAYYDYILQLSPKRVIFNPGAENAALARQLRAAGVAVVHACTLVLLATGNYETVMS